MEPVGAPGDQHDRDERDRAACGSSSRTREGHRGRVRLRRRVTGALRAAFAARPDPRSSLPPAADRHHGPRRRCGQPRSSRRAGAGRRPDDVRGRQRGRPGSRSRTSTATSTGSRRSSRASARARPRSTTTATAISICSCATATRLTASPRAPIPTPSSTGRTRRSVTRAVGAEAGLRLRGWFQGAYAADYDGDGRTDLFLTAFGGTRLFRNLGGGAVRGRHAGRGRRDPGLDDRGGVLRRRRRRRPRPVRRALREVRSREAPERRQAVRVPRPPGRVRPARARGGARRLPRERGRALRRRHREVRVRRGASGLRARRGRVRLRPGRRRRRLRRERLDGERPLGEPEGPLRERRGERSAATSARAAGRRRAWASTPRTSTGTAAPTSSSRTSSTTPTRSTCNVNDGPRARVLRRHRGRAASARRRSPLSAGARASLDFDRDGWPDIVVANGHIYPAGRRRGARDLVRAEEPDVPEPGKERGRRDPVRGGPARRAGSSRRAGSTAGSSRPTSTTTATRTSSSSGWTRLPPSAGTTRNPPGHWVGRRCSPESRRTGTRSAPCSS